MRGLYASYGSASSDFSPSWFCVACPLMASLQVSAVCQPLVSGAGLEQTAPSTTFSYVFSHGYGALAITSVAFMLLAYLVQLTPRSPAFFYHHLALFSLTNLSASSFYAAAIIFSILGSQVILSLSLSAYSVAGALTTVVLGSIFFTSYLGSRYMSPKFDNLFVRACPRSGSMAVLMTPSRRPQDPDNPYFTGV